MTDLCDWDTDPDVKEQTASYLYRSLRTLWKLIAIERSGIIKAVIALLLVETMHLSVPLLFRELIDALPTVLEHGLTPNIAIIVIGMFAIRIAMLAIRRFVQEPLFLKALIRLENYWPSLAQEKLLALSIGYHERENTGRKIAKVSKGVEKLVDLLADLFWTLLPALFFLSINIPIIFLMDWRLGILFILPLFPFMWINMKSYRIFYPSWEAWEKQKEESVGLFCQSIINVRTIQAFVRERREADRHRSVRESMRRMDIQTSIRLQKYFFVMETILGISFLVTLVTGLFFVARGWSTIGTITYIFVTGNLALQNLWGMVHVYTRMLRNLVAAERLQTIFDEPIEVANTSQGRIPEIKEGALTLLDVTHTYKGKEIPVIKNITLTIEPGVMIAFVGKSGSGKSTLVSLIARVQDPSQGVIRFDGCDIRSVDRDWYRRLYAIVPQDVEIYEGSIRYNVALACPDAPEQLLKQALETACLLEVISDRERFPEGLETLVGERGVRLSGGERQRVGIARASMALLSGSRILILDEATSSLDSQSERVVQSFIERLREKNDITIIVIAHRLSTIYAADRICVIEDGQIAETGNHEQLLRGNGLYARLVALQNMNVLHE